MKDAIFFCVKKGAFPCTTHEFRCNVSESFLKISQGQENSFLFETEINQVLFDPDYDQDR